MFQNNKRKLRKQAVANAFPDYGQPQAKRGSRPGWGDALAMVGGAMMDMDGSMGHGHMSGAMTRTQQRIRLKDEAKQAELDEKRRQAILGGMNLTEQQRALMALNPKGATEALTAQGFAGPQERKIIEGADGYKYYQDTGERALPDVQAPAPEPDYKTVTTDKGIFQYDPSDPEGTWQLLGQTPAKSPLVQVNQNPTPEQYAHSLLEPPQTKGKDSAIVFDENGMIRVSPNAQQSGINKSALKFNELTAKNGLVRDDISRALDLFTDVDDQGNRIIRKGQMAIGPQAAFKDLPIFGASTEAGSMESLLLTLKANVGFDELQAMREASPTGGALGAVSEREIAFLQALLGDLEQARDPELFMYNLTRLDEFLAGRQERYRKAFEMDYPELSTSIGRREEARNEVEEGLLEFMTPEERALFGGGQ